MSSVAPLAPIDFGVPPPNLRVSASGTRVVLGIDSAIAVITPDAADDFQALFERAIAEARGNALRRTQA